MDCIMVKGGSQWTDMLSGISQGSVLGPLLFLIFINNLEDDLVSIILKFADDTKIFRKLINAMDGLQQDLNRLCDWLTNGDGVQHSEM